MTWLEQAEGVEDRVFMQHWNEFHHAASTDDKAEGVSEVSYFRMTHEQDHDLGEGMTTPHRHLWDSVLVDLAPKHDPAEVAKQTSWLQRFADLFR